MKKLYIISLTILLVLNLFGCSKKDTWEDKYNEALQNLENDNYGEAITNFNEALSLDDKQASIYLSLGDIYINTKEYEKAQEILTKGFAETNDEKINLKLIELEQNLKTEKRNKGELVRYIQELRRYLDEAMENEANKGCQVEKRHYAGSSMINDWTMDYEDAYDCSLGNNTVFEIITLINGNGYILAKKKDYGKSMYNSFSEVPANSPTSAAYVGNELLTLITMDLNSIVYEYYNVADDYDNLDNHKVIIIGVNQRYFDDGKLGFYVEYGVTDTELRIRFEFVDDNIRVNMPANNTYILESAKKDIGLYFEDIINDFNNLGIDIVNYINLPLMEQMIKEVEPNIIG